MITMECAICGMRTNWDESYGPKHFLVCPHCFNELVKKHKNQGSKLSVSDALEEVFKLAETTE